MKYHKNKHQASKNNSNEKKNSPILTTKHQVDIFTLSTDASGIAKCEDGTIVFVNNMLPQESALVQIQSVKSNYKRAVVLKRDNNSPHRVEPPCSYSVTCGGCQLQHVNEAEQSNIKIQWFFETLKRIGKWNDQSIKSAEKNLNVVYLKIKNYRRRIRLHYNGKALGFHEKESNQIVDIQSCLIARPKLNEKLSELRQNLSHIYEELKAKFNLPNFLLDIELTETDEEKILISFTALELKQNLSQDQKEIIKKELDKVYNVSHEQLIHIRHPLVGKFKLKKESFIQPHMQAIESYVNHMSKCVEIFLNLYSNTIAIKNLPIENNLPIIQAFDLYCGSGIFSCIPYLVAKELNIYCKVLAIEGVQQSIDSFHLNYKNDALQGVVQNVFDFIDEQFSNSEKRNKTQIIILDPPRTGVGIENMQKIVELCAPESCVMYLACDPASFARDTRILLEGGFTPKQIYFFDSFGHTRFYEVLGFFTKGV